MKATDILQEEHRVILRVLQCLSAAADRAEKEGGLDVESIPKMLEFFRGFADRCHHGKEEAHFFPVARQRGVGCAPASLDSLPRNTKRAAATSESWRRTWGQRGEETVKPRPVSSSMRGSTCSF